MDMTKEEVKRKYKELLEADVAEVDRIISEAKANGTWNSGLDTNRHLFDEWNEEFDRRLHEITAGIDLDKD